MVNTQGHYTLAELLESLRHHANAMRAYCRSQVERDAWVTEHMDPLLDDLLEMRRGSV